MVKRSVGLLFFAASMSSLRAAAELSLDAARLQHEAANPGLVKTHVHESFAKKGRKLNKKSRMQGPEDLLKEAEAAQHPEEKLFVLESVDIRGSKVFSQKEFFGTYRSFLKKSVSFKDIQTIRSNITEHYQKNQYFFVKVLLPEQKIEEGKLQFQIIESVIAGINLEGEAGKTKRFFDHYEAVLQKEPTFNYKSIKKTVFLANQLPGVKAQAILAVSEKKPNAADLNLFVNKSPSASFLHLNTRNGRLLGPSQVIVGHTQFNPFFGGDQISAIFAFNPNDPYRMRYASGSFKQTFYDGSNFELSGNASRTQPGGIVSLLEFEGRSSGISLKVSKPIISSFRSQWNVFSQVDVSHTETVINKLGVHDSDNRTRVLRVGTFFESNDRYGQNNIELTLSQGLKAFGAFKAISQASGAERPGNLNFTNLGAEYIRLQYLSQPITVQWGVKAQVASRALLTSEKFFYGGRNYGRAYDNSEITGDSGITTYIEFRLDTTPDIPYLKGIQYYGFYDIGVMFNREIPDLRRQSGASAGFGARLYSSKVKDKLRWFASTEMTFPLTRTILSEGNRTPRMFFFLNVYM